MLHAIRGLWAGLLALVLAAVALPALAELDRPRFAGVLAAARTYADERTFIFYCLRTDAAQRPYLYFLIHADLEDALKKIRAAGANNDQSGVLVETVWANVKAAAPDARDAARDARCAATNVMDDILTLRGVGAPLILRPALRALN